MNHGPALKLVVGLLQDDLEREVVMTRLMKLMHQMLELHAGTLRALTLVTVIEDELERDEMLAGIRRGFQTEPMLSELRTLLSLHESQQEKREAMLARILEQLG